mmetsp:Transcript_44640/g.66236  ORF Transcript_44640/g.66236 Transcript_44640/m.66236 type:complete len:80 (-) Transcript_44640:325-564(-)
MKNSDEHHSTREDEDDVIARRSSAVLTISCCSCVEEGILEEERMDGVIFQRENEHDLFPRAHRDCTEISGGRGRGAVWI